jgi:peptidylprolyl isomerase
MKILILFVTVFALPVFGAVKKPTISELMESAKPTDWRAVDNSNVLYMDLPAGRVVIELNPKYAPQSVANVKALAREKYWDGLAIVRAQDNYVVQWADPDAENAEKKKKLKNAKDHVPAELDLAIAKDMAFNPLPDKDIYADKVGFSDGFAAGRDLKAKKTWLIHCYGAVGVGRDNAPDSGNGTELYAVIGNSPRPLDRNVTVIGRVLQGMELLSTLPRGTGKMGFFEKPEQRIAIRSLHLASEVPEKERLNLEVLRTDTKLFADLLAARRSRREDWFQYRSGHIDICNIPIPVRTKP